MHAGGYLSRIVAPISLVLQVAAGDTWGGSLNPSLSTHRFASEFYFAILIFDETPDSVNYCNRGKSK